MSEQAIIPASVAKKLMAVMAEVGYIKKDKKNEFHKYTYASELAIKDTLHPVLVKHGLLFLPIGCDVISDIEIVTSKGNKERLMTVRYHYRFVDSDTGEYFEAYSLGTGTDSSDKSAYKAITGCIKYILTSTFLIPTGDDPEDGKEKRGSREAQKAVADVKLGRQAPMPPEYTQQPSEAPPPPRPQAVPGKTTKNFKALEVFRDIKAAMGEKLYYFVLAHNGYQKSNQILEEERQRAVYKQMVGVKKIADAAAHGEIAEGMTAELFKALPDSSVAAIQREFRNKMAQAFGTEVGPQEYEELRAKSTTNWDFFKTLQAALEGYAQTIGA